MASTPDGFRPFYVTRLVRESARLLSLHLAPSDGTAAPRWWPGQCVQVRLRNGDSDVAGNYSISSPDCQGLRISVTLDGRVGALLHAVAVGSSIEVSLPRGGFDFDPADTEPAALISAGSGVGPFVACLLAQAAQHPHRRLVWVHVVAHRPSILRCSGRSRARPMPEPSGTCAAPAPTPRRPEMPAAG